MRLAIRYIYVILTLSIFAGCSGREKEHPEPEVDSLYGINSSPYNIRECVIDDGHTMGEILSGYGVSMAKIDELDRTAKSVFRLGGIRAGNKYTAFLRRDSVQGEVLEHLVYERNPWQYVTFSFAGDSVAVALGEKPIEVVRRRAVATVESSLWAAMTDAGMPVDVTSSVEEIYQWSVDFFGIQKGDQITVVYDEKVVDGEIIGIGQVWGAKFIQDSNAYYAIPFEVGGKVQYWDENAKSLRKQMLKAPLKYSRISSRFSNSRLHPVLKIRRPHHGVDYAAPSGTPVVAVSDGVVVHKGWDARGGGNMLKIKHRGGVTTGYLHLRGFASGMRVGKRVSQGQLIGYVGSTGRSTGPHLDYRVWRNGRAVDPLKLPQLPPEPIPESMMSDFEYVRDGVTAEVDGQADSTKIITSLDVSHLREAKLSNEKKG